MYSYFFHYTCYKYGYIDREGQVVIEPRFDFAGDFSEGLASIGYRIRIEDADEEVVERQSWRFTKDFSFFESEAEQKWVRLEGFVDRAGTIVVEPRFDSRAKLYGVKLKKKPSDYIRENIVVTTSGMFSFEPIDCALKALGRENVMYSADYPFENPAEAGEFMDKLPLDRGVIEDISYNNAARLLRIGAP